MATIYSKSGADAAIAAAIDALNLGTAGTYLVPDPVYPGLYLAASGSSMTPDPDHTGLYTIGTLA